MSVEYFVGALLEVEINVGFSLNHQRGKKLEGINSGCVSFSPEVRVAVQASEMQSQAHRPLTLYRRVRGFVCLIILLSTAFVALVILAPFAFLFLRLFSVHYSRYWTSFFMGRWLSMWPYLFETVNETKVPCSVAPFVSLFSLKNTCRLH